MTPHVALALRGLREPRGSEPIHYNGNANSGMETENRERQTWREGKVGPWGDVRATMSPGQLEFSTIDRVGHVQHFIKLGRHHRSPATESSEPIGASSV